MNYNYMNQMPYGVYMPQGYQPSYQQGQQPFQQNWAQQNNQVPNQMTVQTRNYNQQAQQVQQGQQPSQPVYQPQQTQFVADNIFWVQGIEAAKAAYVQPGHVGLFMDSESNTFYMKSVNWDGRPNPLQICDYVIRDENVNGVGVQGVNTQDVQQVDESVDAQPESKIETQVSLSSEYMTRDEVYALLDEITGDSSSSTKSAKDKVKDNGESTNSGKEVKSNAKSTVRNVRKK